MECGVPYGVDATVPPETSADEIREEVREYAERLGETPTLKGFCESYNRSPQTVYKYFESWNSLVNSLDLQPNHEYHDRDELIAKLWDLYEDLDRVPKAPDFIDEYGITSKVWVRLFGSWFEFVEAAGFDTSEIYGRGASDERLLDHLEELAEQHGRVPSAELMRQEGEFYPGIYERRFDGWINALEKAGFDWEPLSGEDHPRYTDDPDENQRYHPIYHQTRPKVVAETNGECWHCGMGRQEHMDRYGWDLEVHHIIPDWLTADDDPSVHRVGNLVPLCHEHHRHLYDGMMMHPKEVLRVYAPN